jgi:hypothetical protein
VRRLDGLAAFLDGGAEAEAPDGPCQVVVDGLGDTDHANGETALRNLFGEGRCAAERTVAADGEQHAHPARDERVEHLRWVLGPP